MWYKNSSNVISVALCVVTCVLAFNYWSVSQDMVVVDAKVKVCHQKELDFNGVASECKKRITELHDKISVLNSDKEVIATQKNSLLQLANARQEQVNEAKKEKQVAENARDECLGRETNVDSERDELLAKVHQLDSKNLQLEAQIQTLTAQLEAKNKEPQNNAPLNEEAVAAQPAAVAAQPAAV